MLWQPHLHVKYHTLHDYPATPGVVVACDVSPAVHPDPDSGGIEQGRDEILFTTAYYILLHRDRAEGRDETGVRAGAVPHRTRTYHTVPYLALSYMASHYQPLPTTYYYILLHRTTTTTYYYVLLLTTTYYYLLLLPTYYSLLLTTIYF